MYVTLKNLRIKIQMWSFYTISIKSIKKQM